MYSTFKRGVHPKDNKDMTEKLAFEIMPVPDKVYIPLSQHIGAICTPCVGAGDFVKAGTLIGRAAGKVSANVHSSVSGEVLGYEMRELANGTLSKHVVIKNDFLYDEETLPPLENPTAEEIKKRCKEAGIVGMGGATFPTEIKLNTDKKIDLLIINGAECEPYITTDFRMMMEFPDKILKGVEFIRRALNAPSVFIGIEDNKPEAINEMNGRNTNPYVRVFPLKTKYPQGGEKQLIYALTGLKVPNGGLPSDLGIIVLNISTAYALYEAVEIGKPCYSRFMTVSGKGIKRPANLFVRFGTPFSAIVEYLETNDDYVKAVSGGPMMGISISSFEVAVAKGNTALLLLVDNEIRAVEPSPCINCARCHAVCPINLMPMMTDALILKNRIKETIPYNPLSCIECGCCAYVCPAKRPLVQSQRLAKKLIREKKLQ